MKARLFAALLVALAPAAANAADDDNPYRTVKVGDFATYKTISKAMGMTVEGSATRTVTAKDDKEATVAIVVKAPGVEKKDAEKIDLTRHYDPTKGALPPGFQVKMEKAKDGKEKVKVGGKEYDCTWETYTLTGTVNDLKVTGEIKVWQSKDLPLQMVKSEMTAEVAKQKFEIHMELTESGRKD